MGFPLEQLTQMRHTWNVGPWAGTTCDLPLLTILQVMAMAHTGFQKDRDRGTAGPKEGVSPIGRFGLKGQLSC